MIEIILFRSSSIIILCMYMSIKSIKEDMIVYMCTAIVVGSLTGSVDIMLIIMILFIIDSGL